MVVPTEPMVNYSREQSFSAAQRLAATLSRVRQHHWLDRLSSSCLLLRSGNGGQRGRAGGQRWESDADRAELERGVRALAALVLLSEATQRCWAGKCGNIYT